MNAKELDQRMAAGVLAPIVKHSPTLRPLSLPPMPEQLCIQAEQREQAELERKERQQQQEAAQRNHRDLLAASELDKRLGGKRACMKMLQETTGKDAPCALLLGPTGCGKTQAARYLARHHSPVLVRASELATADRRHGLGEGFPPDIERARAAKCLIIDDVGHEKDTAALWDILDYRYSNGKPTIVTSGLTKAELTKHVSAACVRRIIEQHCGSQVLIVDCHEGSE